MKMHTIIQTVLCLFLFIANIYSAEIPIVVSRESKTTVQIGANASRQERFAASEIQTFIEKHTGAKVELRTNQEQTTTSTVIVLGTPASNPTVLAVLSDRGVELV